MGKSLARALLARLALLSRATLIGDQFCVPCGPGRPYGWLALAMPGRLRPCGARRAGETQLKVVPCCWRATARAARIAYSCQAHCVSRQRFNELNCHALRSCHVTANYGRISRWNCQIA